MTSPEDQMQDIERDEQWLRDTCDDPTGPDVDAIRKRVAIEIREQWLKSENHGETPPGLSDRVKRSVRQAVRRTRRERARPAENDGNGMRLKLAVRRVCVVLSAAACLLILISLQRGDPSTTELSAVDAFQSYSEDEFSGSISDIADDISELELAFDTGDFQWQDDFRFDDLMDEIDDVMMEGEFQNDWS